MNKLKLIKANVINTKLIHKFPSYRKKLLLLLSRIKKPYNQQHTTMAQVDITVVNGSVVLEWLGGENLRKRTFQALSISASPPEKINFYEDGGFKCALIYAQINEIDGVAPTDYEDAFDKILALIPSSGGASGGSYNNTDAYDEDATLPLTFDGNTIHSFSIVAKTGTTTITVNGETTVLIAGQSTTITGTGLIAEEISIDSTTGEFLATTLS